MLILIAALAGAGAQPHITYLECDTMQSGKPMHYAVTLNEAEGTADWDEVPSNGYPRRDPARFTSTSVQYLDTTISRVDLSIERRFTNIVGDPVVESGQCQLAPQVKQAF